MTPEKLVASERQAWLDEERRARLDAGRWAAPSSARGAGMHVRPTARVLDKLSDGRTTNLLAPFDVLWEPVVHGMGRQVARRPRWDNLFHRKTASLGQDLDLFRQRRGYCTGPVLAWRAKYRQGVGHHGRRKRRERFSCGEPVGSGGLLNLPLLVSSALDDTEFYLINGAGVGANHRRFSPRRCGRYQRSPNGSMAL